MAQKKDIADLLPEGLIASRQWLSAQGVPDWKLDHLVRNSALQLVARGVYRRPGPPLKWQAVVISLQSEGMGRLDIAPGGLTALEMHGLAHYMRFGDNRLHLYGSGKLPAWVHTLSENHEFIHHSKTLFAGKKARQRATSAPGRIQVSMEDDPAFKGRVSQPWGTWDWPLALSSPERAVLELMSGVPERFAFEEVDLIMQGLANLSPRQLEEMLLDCTSVKVKRLFFWFAERHGHTWLKRLDPERFDLGSGNRSLVKGGILDKKYRITVPSTFQNDMPK